MHTKQLQLERQKLQIFSCVLCVVGGRQFLQKVFLSTLACVTFLVVEKLSSYYDFHQPKIFLRMFYIIHRIYPILKVIPMPVWFHGSTNTCKLLVCILVFSTQILNLCLLWKLLCYVPPLYLLNETLLVECFQRLLKKKRKKIVHWSGGLRKREVVLLSLEHLIYC